MNARISVHYAEECGPYRQQAAQFLQVASRYELWWSERAPDQTALLPSFVRLSDEFFEEVTNRPVPLDMQALRLLKGSPMRLDLYVWLTYRMSYLRRPTAVTWDQLRLQFGTQAQTRAARHAFKNELPGPPHPGPGRLPGRPGGGDRDGAAVAQPTAREPQRTAQPQPARRRRPADAVGRGHLAVPLRRRARWCGSSWGCRYGRTADSRARGFRCSCAWMVTWLEEQVARWGRRRALRLWWAAACAPGGERVP